jgi:hypothetical protein
MRDECVMRGGQWAVPQAPRCRHNHFFIRCEAGYTPAKRTTQNSVFPGSVLPGVLKYIINYFKD